MIHKRTGKRIINRKTGKNQAYIRKAIAIALTITLLPIESVLGCIPEKVHAAENTEPKSVSQNHLSFPSLLLSWARMVFSIASGV